MLKTTLSAALLATTGLTSLAQAAETLEITRIELGQAGIARYAMQGAILGNSLSFAIPQEAASDVLASLIVRDPAGGVIDLQTDVPGAERTLLRGTPFANGVQADTASILRALIGQTISIGGETGTTRGLLMGVNRVDAVENGQRVSRDTALMLSDGQMIDVVLAPGAQISFPQEIAETLAAALQAKSRDTSMTQFDLTLEAMGPRDIQMSYVTEAPAWKNSWRLLLDEGRLQGWATLENLSGQDWEGVQVSLTTGAPVAYRRNLIDPRLLARPDIKDLGPEPVRAQKDSAALGLLSLHSSGTAHQRALKGTAVPLVPSSGAARQGQAEQAHGLLRYELPHKIDLAYGRSTTMLYLDLQVEPEIHALYRPESQDERVFLSVALHSETPLAAGLISVQGDGGFVGDAPFGGALAGHSTMLPYALAPGSKMLTTVEDGTELASLKLSGDQLHLTVLRSRITEYQTDVAETVARFTVDHPAHFGKVTQTNGTHNKRPGADRITVPVENGKGLIRVTETTTESGAIPLEARSVLRLLRDMQNEGGTVAPDLVPVIDRALDLYAQIERVASQRKTVEAQYAALSTEQKRLRDSLETVQQSALRQRYLETLNETEQRIADVLERTDDLQTQTEQLNEALVAVFREL